MAKLKHTFKNDILFKLLFTKNPHLLERFVSRLLNIPPESIQDFKIVNPEMPPDIVYNKLCRLDILMEVDGQKVNLEVTRNVSLTDRMVIHFFELEKLPKEINKDDISLLWLRLFKADTEEELQMSSESKYAEVNEVITAYRNLMASEEFREYERIREKAELDERQRTNNAVRRGIEKADKKWQSVVAEKDAEISDQAAEIAKKEAENASMADEIAKLKKKLAK